MREYKQLKREENMWPTKVELKKVSRFSVTGISKYGQRSIPSFILACRTSTAIPTIVVNHATLRLQSLTFDMGPSTLSASLSNLQPAELRPRPFEAEREILMRWFGTNETSSRCYAYHWGVYKTCAIFLSLNITTISIIFNFSNI